MKKYYYIIVVLLTVVVHLTVFPQVIDDSVFVHYTLDMDRDWEKPFLSLSSLLEYLPGIYQFGVQTPGQYQSLLRNGTRENHSIILMDGLPLQDYLSDIPYLSFIPVETIKKIDLYPGLNPFGIDAVGAVINITTKEFTENKPYTKFVYCTGSGLYSDFDVSYGQPIGSKIKIFSGVMLKKFGVRKSTNEELPYRKYEAQITRAGLLYSLNDYTKFRYDLLSNRHSLKIPFNIPQDTSLAPSRNIFRIDHTLRSSLDLPNLKTSVWLHYISEKMKLKEFRFYPPEKLSYQSQQLKIVQNTKLFFPLSWGLDYSHCNLTDTSRIKHTYFYRNFFLHLNIPLPKTINFLSSLNLTDSKYTDPALKFSGLLSYVSRDDLNISIEYNQNARLPELPCRYGFPLFLSTPLSRNNYNYRNVDLTYKENFGLLSEQSERIQFFCQYGSLQNYHFSALLYYQSGNNLISITQLKQANQNILSYENNFSTTYTGINSTIFFNIFKNVHFSSSFDLIKSLNKDSLNHIDLPRLQGLTALSWSHGFFKDDLYITLFASLKYWSEFSFFTLTDAHIFTRQTALPKAILNTKASFRVMDHTYITFSVDNMLNQKVSGTYHVFIPYSFYRIGISWELYN